ncbi:MAG: hypothetical protein QI197_06345 [Candidatus Korarchaeota archaeon]|nr:hypothetical protein [Candidatus Korarchaeota archaeon]
MSEFLAWVKRWFDVDLSGYSLIRSGKKRIRFLTKEAAGFDVKDVIRGVYLAKKAPYGYIISVEGSYVIGRGASRHVVELSEEEFRRWMRGEDIAVELPERGVYLVKFGPVFAGSGYYNGEVLRNLIPKSRTVEP